MIIPGLSACLPLLGLCLHAQQRHPAQCASLFHVHRYRCQRSFEIRSRAASLSHPWPEALAPSQRSLDSMRCAKRERSTARIMCPCHPHGWSDKPLNKLKGMLAGLSSPFVSRTTRLSLGPSKGRFSCRLASSRHFPGRTPLRANTSLVVVQHLHTRLFACPQLARVRKSCSMGPRIGVGAQILGMGPRIDVPFLQRTDRTPGRTLPPVDCG